MWRPIPRTTSTSRSDSQSSSGTSHGRSRKSGWPVRATSSRSMRLRRRDGSADERPDAAGVADEDVAGELGHRAEVADDPPALPRQVVVRAVRTHTGDAVVLDHALRAVVAL